MGIGPRLPFVEFTPGARLFRGLRTDSLVEVQPCSPHAKYLHARRVGNRTWQRCPVELFLKTHEEIQPTKARR